MEFDELVRAASEIQQAKDNCLEVGSSSVCGVSGGRPDGGKPKQLAACHRCNTMSHSDTGFTPEVREKFCKGFKAKCKNVTRLVTLQTCVSRVSRVALRMQRRQRFLC